MGEKILVTGAGGLGCELLKLLSLDPTNVITVIDNDTIDPTNLNRQFLFVKEDVDKSKSETAAKKMSSKVNITGIFGKINEYKSIDFYKKFDVVFNCLDNNEARSFVNQRCYAAGVKMIDGGSSGWLGQSFYNGKECFECLPKRQAKEYPICTIRQKPETFEHCLAWAKVIVEKCDYEGLDEEILLYYKYTRETRAKEKASKNNLSAKSNDSLSKNGENLNEKNAENKSNNKLETSEDLLILSNTEPPIKKIKIKKLKNEIEEFDFLDSVSVSNFDEKIYKLACFRATRFEIKHKDFNESRTFINNIVPSVCTTNSMVVSLMILSSKIKKNYFLVQTPSNFLKVDLNDKNKACPVCSVPLYHCKFGPKTTSLDFLKEFGGKSMIINNEIITKDLELPLCTYNGDFAIVSKNNYNYSVYFEYLENESDLSFIRLK